MINFTYFYENGGMPVIPFMIIMTSFVGTGIIILLGRTPLIPTLGLLLLFINTAVLFLYLNLEFLSLIYLVVYIGAICVFFLFIILLLNLRTIEKNILNIGPILMAFMVAIISGFFYYYASSSYFLGKNVENSIFSTELSLGIIIILLKHPFLFVMLTIILLLAIILPILIAKEKYSALVYQKKQELFFSLSKNTEGLLNIIQLKEELFTKEKRKYEEVFTTEKLKDDAVNSVNTEKLKDDAVNSVNTGKEVILADLTKIKALIIYERMQVYDKEKMWRYLEKKNER